MNGHSAGDTVTGALREIVGQGKFVESSPTCPSNGTYSYMDDDLPLSGSLYMTCSLAATEKHVPSDFADW